MFDAWGLDRCLWGTDWTRAHAVVNYEQAVEPFLKLAHLYRAIWIALARSLSRSRWLFVVARNSSFTYKGKSVNVCQVGRELGVRYVLEGSVRKLPKAALDAQAMDAPSRFRACSAVVSDFHKVY